MAATISAFSVSLTGLTDAEIVTLKAAIPPNGVFATFVQNSSQGNLSDLTQTDFNGTITIRPAAPNNNENCGGVMDMVESVVPNPLMGWEQSA